MKRQFAGLVMAGVLLVATGCAAAGGATHSSPEASTTSETGQGAAENGDVGVCHSVSMALTMLAQEQAAFGDGSLDREAFNVSVGGIAKSFGLLRIMHDDSVLIPAAERLGSAIGDLATTEGEPNTGDATAVGQLQTTLATSSAP